MRSFRRPKRSKAAALLACLAGVPAAGCVHDDRAVATSPVPDDYHLRHPVVLADGPRHIDIFLVGSSGKLDFRQAHDLTAFAAEYNALGQGRIRALVPHGAVDAWAADATLDAIRRGLAAASVKGDIEVGTYKVLDPALAAPVRLSFRKLQAKLASRCGDWPEDLGSGHDVEEWENRSYYNLGCATQRTLTAQIDDPRDLVRPRAEDPSDVEMRTRAIGDIRGSQDARQATDPSTAWGATRPIFNTGN